MGDENLRDKLDRHFTATFKLDTSSIDEVNEVDDNVNHPAHYTMGRIETIEAISAALGDEGFQSYCAGNVLKYVWRYRHKGGKESLEKARWYLDRLIAEVGKGCG